VVVEAEGKLRQLVGEVEGKMRLLQPRVSLGRWLLMPLEE